VESGSQRGRSRIADAAPWVAAAAIAAAVVAVYGQTLDFEFVRLDDPEYVANPMVARGLDPESLRWAFTTRHLANWHPLTWLSFMLGVEIHGPGPAGHHAVNLTLHLVNSLILLGLLCSASGRLGPSALVAALFALHPLHVESVAWVSERKDVLSTCFGFLAMAAWLGYARRGGLARYALVALCFVLCLLAKAMLVTLPVLLLLLDYWPLGRLGRGGASPLRLVAEKLPLLALSLAVSAVTLGVQVIDARVAPLDAAANAVVSYAVYLRKAFWPSGLGVLYPHPGLPSEGGVPLTALAIGASLALLVGISLGVAFARRRYLWTGWLWYLGALVPVIGLVQAGRQGMADRYTYVPLVGVFLMLAFGGAELVEKWRRRQPQAGRIAAAGALAALAALSVAAHRQARVWRDSVSLFEHSLAVMPANPTLHYNLGNTYGSAGRLDDATQQYRLALAVKPRHQKAHYNLASILLAQRRVDEAIEHLRRALAIDPDYARAHHKLANALHGSGRLEEAVHHYRETLRVAPGNAAARRDLEIALAELGPAARGDATPPPGS